MESYKQPHQFVFNRKFLKKLFKRLLILSAFVIQIIHTEHLLVEFIKEFKGDIVYPKQAITLFEHCFTFNCQFIISLGGQYCRLKRRKKYYNKPRSTNDTV